MVKKKKSFWSIFRPVAVAIVALVTSVVASQSPELSPVIHAVGNAATKILMTADNKPAQKKDSILIDSTSTVEKPLQHADSILYNS